MLGVNLLFAGFALTLNGFSYITKVDAKVKGVSNILVGIVIAINAVFQTAQATEPFEFGFSAAMWMFALNYLIIGAHVLFNSENWKVFGLYSLFASVVSFTYVWDSIVTEAPAIMIYLWAMWGVLWLQSFLAILVGMKSVDKYSWHVLILNGVASTFVPGLLMLLGYLL